MPTEVRYPGRARAVRFLARPNRFLARVQGPRGPPFLAHVPNPGRMEELLVEGETRGFVVPVDAPGRRTLWDLVVVRHGRSLVSVDAGLANRLVGEVLRRRPPAGVARGPWRAEVPYGGHRFDFGLRAGPRSDWSHLLEVKSSNLRVGETALFPDAPTRRGAAHLRTLAAAQRRGLTCRVLFAVQRDDVRRFAPNRALDPELGAAFDEALGAGVRISAHTLRVAPDGVAWGREVPVDARLRPERIK